MVSSKPVKLEAVIIRFSLARLWSVEVNLQTQDQSCPNRNTNFVMKIPNISSLPLDQRIPFSTTDLTLYNALVQIFKEAKRQSINFLK